MPILLVYLVKAPDSTKDPFDSWLCGGALVTPSQILTSAACITESDNIFAIAGYRKYVNGMDLDSDNCTKLKKERIVKIRIPREHVQAHEYANTTRWMSLDIGVATVEHPYDFEDVTFRIYCSYIPAVIEINYNTNLDKRIGTDVVALGWGRDRGSASTDLVDLNSETLREVSTTIRKKEDCIKQFKGNGLSRVIDKYMICTHGKGLLDGEGNVKEMENNCSNDQSQVQNAECNYDLNLLNKYKSRSSVVVNKTRRINNSDRNINIKNMRASKITRRQGICQNDRGGPLITWVGSTELMIGVAVNSLYDAEFNCVGPYIFVSTSAVGQIVKCLLSTDIVMRKSCSRDVIGFEIFENVTQTKAVHVSLRSRTDYQSPKITSSMREDVSSDNLDSIEVYLLNSPYSENQPDAWLCGGVLISTTHVLTAAACLIEVTHIYVIAGYRKYVSAKNIQNDLCTRSRKQKIVKIIIPKAYNTSMWIKFDVGLGVVEKPYDFFDMSYRKICSYEPGAISINYDIKMESRNASALALGWGGTKAREPGIGTDINSEYLMEAHTIITDKSFCRKQFSKTVDYYFLCTYGLENVAKIVEDIAPFQIKQDKCDYSQYNLNATIPAECLENVEVSNRRVLITNYSDPSINGTDNKNITLNENKLDINSTMTRKQGTEENYGGICQNDHGGPLVAFADGKEIVIGVALNSVYNYNYQCKGPSLYLSTAQSSVLIKCLLSSFNETRKLCESLNYEIKEFKVNWPHESTQETGIQEYRNCKSDNCRGRVRIRPQMRLLDLAQDKIEES